MRTVHRLAALVGSTALAVGSLTAFTAAPAVAADGKCLKATTISNTWGKVTYSKCWKDITVPGHPTTRHWAVRGTLTDVKTDGCNVRAEFVFKAAGGTKTQVSKITTGSSKTFATEYTGGSTITASLSKVC
jgi:hypothetical protein